MCRLREHVHRTDLLDAVFHALILLKLEQTLEVSGECGWITGYIYKLFYLDLRA